MKKLYEDFIAAVSAGIKGQKSEIEPEKYTQLALMAKAHGLNGIIYNVFDKADAVPYAQRKKAKYIQNITVFARANQMAEYQRIREMFEKNGIVYIPLKGVILQEMYPYPWMREMTDIDIYVRKESLCEIRKLMENDGYSFKHKGHHDVYTKLDIISVEIHEKLIDEQRETGFDEFFDKPEKFCKNTNTCKKELIPEYEYIYLISHLYGHFHQGGCGVRYILDIWIYLDKHKNLDMKFINNIFDECGIGEFAENIRILAMYWFGEGRKNNVCDALGEYIIECGTYGKIKTLVMDMSDGSLSSKLKLIKRKALLKDSEIQKRTDNSRQSGSKLLYRIQRIFDIAYKNRTELNSWIKNIRTDKSTVRKHKEMMKSFGINE